MKKLGPFPSAEDDVTFVWLRAFPDAASREALKGARRAAVGGRAGALGVEGAAGCGDPFRREDSQAAARPRSTGRPASSQPCLPSAYFRTFV